MNEAAGRATELRFQPHSCVCRELGLLRPWHLLKHGFHTGVIRRNLCLEKNQTHCWRRLHCFPCKDFKTYSCLEKSPEAVFLAHESVTCALRLSSMNVWWILMPQGIMAGEVVKRHHFRQWAGEGGTYNWSLPVAQEKVFIIFTYMCMCMSVCTRQRVQVPWEAWTYWIHPEESQAVVGYLTMVLGTKPVSSTETASALKFWGIQPTRRHRWYLVYRSYSFF